MNVLAIETSCDETGAAVVKDGSFIINSVVATSKTMHEKWGGIVPEIAAREQLSSIIPVLMETLSVFQSNTSKKPNSNKKYYLNLIQKHIDMIAVTIGPGLIGSLVIGVETAKTMAMASGKPIIPVNHVLAHMYANFINENLTCSDLLVSKNHVSNKHKLNFSNHIPNQNNHLSIQYPAISLVVSGGHTELYLMKSPNQLKWLGGTIDDAAGEAFDKTARFLGFGHGGGAAIENAATKYLKSHNLVSLPRPLLYHKSFNFSFSGLKTAVIREWKKQSIDDVKNNDIVNAFAHEIQESITDVLVEKTWSSVVSHQAKSILISGGVAANQRLRLKFHQKISKLKSSIRFYCPSLYLCTDNAAMTASAAYFIGKPVAWKLVEAQPELSAEI